MTSQHFNYPIRRLFIDCDDTLVLWLDERGMPLKGENPMGVNSHDGNWKPNTRLILEIEKWVEINPHLEVIVWSGGGDFYAGGWGQRLLHHIEHVAYAKDTRVPMVNDIAIDDMDALKLRCPIRDPLTWVHTDD